MKYMLIVCTHAPYCNFRNTNAIMEFSQKMFDVHTAIGTPVLVCDDLERIQEVANDLGDYDVDPALEELES